MITGGRAGTAMLDFYWHFCRFQSLLGSETALLCRPWTLFFFFFLIQHGAHRGIPRREFPFCNSGTFCAALCFSMRRREKRLSSGPLALWWTALLQSLPQISKHQSAAPSIPGWPYVLTEGLDSVGEAPTGGETATEDKAEVLASCLSKSKRLLIF